MAAIAENNSTQETYVASLLFNFSQLNEMEKIKWLKFNRLFTDMSVKELASGILSMDNYLLAEAGEYKLDAKMYTKLCNRMGIPEGPYKNPVVVELFDKFKESLTHIKYKAKLMEMYTELMSHPRLFLEASLFLDITVHLIRYYVVTGDVESAQVQVDEAERFIPILSKEQLFFFNKFKGVLAYVEEDFEKALELYYHCEQTAPHELTEMEWADLYYSIGLATSRLGDAVHSRDYMDKALQIYQDHFYPKRIAECHLNLGLAEHRLRNFKRGMKHFEVSMAIIEELDLPALQFLVEFTYGYVYFQFQSYETAIKHLTNCMEFLEPVNVIDHIRCYTVLVSANYEIGRKDQANKWAEMGKALLKDLGDEGFSNKMMEITHKEFQMILALAEDDFERYEDLSLNYVIPHYKAEGYDIDLGYYYTQLANFYVKRNMFEQATEILMKASRLYQQVISLK